MSTEGEKCQRCGEVGEDRRTLWMACFYEMKELGLPFDEKTLFHADDTVIDVGSVSGTVCCSGDLTPQGFYTLRVCKDCRADWMDAIKRWFEKVPRRESCGSGIFVRENGADVEITQEEWDRRNLNRVPTRCR